MQEKRSFLKWSGIPLILVVMMLIFSGYMAWKEHSIYNGLVDQSLKGNPIAIEILIKYEKPWKLDERLIQEAMAGNQNAIKVLGINIDKK